MSSGFTRHRWHKSHIIEGKNVQTKLTG